MRRSLWMVVLGVCLIGGGAGHAAETARFFNALPDVPLMEGLTELGDQTVVFDKPEGRIVESVAFMGAQNSAKVMQYYQDALPQLGWVRIGEHIYQREQEFLTVVAEAGQGGNFLRLRIAPTRQ